MHHIVLGLPTSLVPSCLLFQTLLIIVSYLLSRWYSHLNILLLTIAMFWFYSLSSVLFLLLQLLPYILRNILLLTLLVFYLISFLRTIQYNKESKPHWAKLSAWITGSPLIGYQISLVSKLCAKCFVLVRFLICKWSYNLFQTQNSDNVYFIWRANTTKLNVDVV